MSLEWIDGVPDHWKVAESQFVLDHQKRKVQDDDEIVTAFRDGQVTLRSKRRTDGFTMADKEIGYQHICEGDLVVHSMDGGFGAIGVSDSCGKASPVVHAYTSDSCDLRFISYQLRSAVNAGWIAALAKGIRVRSTQFDQPALAGLKIAYPPLETQQRIADYLDRETAQIDTTVSTLDELIEEMKSRRVQLIQESISSPDSSFQRVPLGLVIRNVPISNAPIKGEMSREPGERLAPAFSASGQDVWMPEELAQLNNPALVISSVGARCGKVFKQESNEPWGVVANTAVYSPGENSDLTFLWYQVNDENFWVRGGSAQPYVQFDRSLQKRIFLPPLETQQRIANFLDIETAKIDKIISTATELRSELLARRSALITEVVTGQRQV